MTLLIPKEPNESSMHQSINLSTVKQLAIFHYQRYFARSFKLEEVMVTAKKQRNVGADVESGVISDVTSGVTGTTT